MPWLHSSGCHESLSFILLAHDLSPPASAHSPEPSSSHRRPQTVSRRRKPHTPSSLSPPTASERCPLAAWPTPQEHPGLAPPGPRMGRRRAAHKYQLRQLRCSPFPSVTECSKFQVSEEGRVLEPGASSKQGKGWGIREGLPGQWHGNSIHPGRTWGFPHGNCSGGFWRSRALGSAPSLPHSNPELPFLKTWQLWRANIHTGDPSYTWWGSPRFQ